MFTCQVKLMSSPIEGLGTFASEFIPQGSTIWVFHPGFDQEFPLTDLEALPACTQERVMHFAYISKQTGKGVLCADDARFMNHADQPNTENRIDERGYEVTVARQDIAAGQEITCNYYEFDADAARKLHGPAWAEQPRG